MKGGVGKTTIAAQIAARFNVFYERNVLLIDLDPQQNLTEFLFLRTQLQESLDNHQSSIGLFEPRKVNVKHESYSDFQCDPTPREPGGPLVQPYNLHPDLLLKNRFDAIPSDMRAIKFTRIDPHETAQCQANFLDALQNYRKTYDYIIIDCNPSVSFATGVALQACDHILIPIKPDSFALAGVQFTKEVLERFYGRAQHIRDGRLKVDCFFNAVTGTDGERRLEEEVRKKFTLGSTLTPKIRQSGFLTIKSLTGIHTQEREPLAEAIIRRVRPGTAARPLRDLCDEYINKLEANHDIKRRNINTLEEGEGFEESAITKEY